jgi:prophage regulatory protein
VAANPKAEERHPPPGRVLIGRKQVRQKIPLCDRTILDMEKRGEFPRRFLIGRSVVVWDLAEVEAWIERQQVANAQGKPPGTKKTSHEASSSSTGMAG